MCSLVKKSSHWKCSVKKAVLKNFAVFTGKHLCWNLFLIKLQLHLRTTASDSYWFLPNWRPLFMSIMICFIVFQKIEHVIWSEIRIMLCSQKWHARPWVITPSFICFFHYFYLYYGSSACVTEKPLTAYVVIIII